MEEPGLVLVYPKKKFGEVSAPVSERPLLSDKHYLFPLIIHWEMSCPLKVSVKLILITRGKAAIPSCQPSHLLEDSAHRLSLQLNLCCQEQLAVFEERDKTSGKCFFAAVEEFPRSTTEKVLFEEDCCGSAVSKTYLTTTGS